MENEYGEHELTFARARHIVQKSEWEDVINPNIRSINTYWTVNFELLKESKNLELLEGDAGIVNGVKVSHAGGHTRGFQTVEIESNGQTAIHLGDLLPTHAHFNPLWIMAYDNFPLESIKNKEELEKKYINKNAWFTFYHDTLMRACRFDEKGNIIEQLPASS
jgi:glyoxylase-like metal-dependent hydrolase (beta-lactamase superfamily II)